MYVLVHVCTYLATGIIIRFIDDALLLQLATGILIFKIEFESYNDIKL